MTLNEQLKEASDRMWLLEEELKAKQAEFNKAAREVARILMMLDSIEPND